MAPLQCDLPGKPEPVVLPSRGWIANPGLGPVTVRFVGHEVTLLRRGNGQVKSHPQAPGVAQEPEGKNGREREPDADLGSKGHAEEDLETKLPRDGDSRGRGVVEIDGSDEISRFTPKSIATDRAVLVDVEDPNKRLPLCANRTQEPHDTASTLPYSRRLSVVYSQGTELRRFPAGDRFSQAFTPKARLPCRRQSASRGGARKLLS